MDFELEGRVAWGLEAEAEEKGRWSRWNFGIGREEMELIQLYEKRERAKGDCYSANGEQLVLSCLYDLDSELSSVCTLQSKANK